MHWKSSVPVSLLFLLLTPTPLLAQSITPANDGTGTQVMQDGNGYTIIGGTRAQENLFHSFERLGLNADEIATFLAQPNIENILGRVTGGDASFIDGLLQVQGSGANLYLMNPAGIVFGSNAQLDLSGSFLATTATGIGFGDRWFNALGNNTYGNLVGTPDSFAFSLANGGAIANLANLTVNPGESLTLLGGTVTNTGTLTAPGGTITLAAVPGGNRVRLNQAGSLLSLELESANGRWDDALNPVNLVPLALPELLTGGNLGNASQLTVNPDGTVRLSGANIPVQDGTALVAGTLNAAGTAAAEINVLGDRVALLNATLDASGTNGGGTIRVGGDYQGSGSVFNAAHTFVSQGSRITADTLGNGNGGRAILWADDTTYFSGTISAQGGSLGGNGGFVEVSGAQNLVFRGTTDLTAPQGALGTLLLDPTNIVIVNGTGAVDDGQLGADVPVGDLVGQIFAGQDAGLDYTISEAALEALDGNANVILEATNDITINPLADGVLTFALGTGTITLTADADQSGAGSFIMQDPTNTLQALGRSLTITGAEISVGNINVGDSTVAAAGSVALTANNGDLRVGSITTAANDDFAGDEDFPTAGNVTLSAPNGSLTTGNIDASTFITGFPSGNGGTVQLSAQDTVQTGNINTLSGGGFGGAITLESSNGSLLTGSLRSLSFAGGGGQNITLTANNGNITTGAIESYGNFTNVGGAVTLTTATGTITTGNILTDNNDISLRGSVVLTNDTSFTNRGGTTGVVEVQGSIDGNHALTVDVGAAAVTITGDIGATTPLGALTINSTGATQLGSTVNAASLQTNAGGTTQLNGDVITTAANGQSYGDALTLNGDIRLIGDEIDFGDTVSGSGNLTLRPFTENQAIALGGTNANTEALDLTTTELGQIQPGFNSITIAGANGTGTLTLNDTSSLTGTPIFLRRLSTLVGPDANTTWRITGSGRGRVNTLNFASIPTLRGGSGDDTFRFNTAQTFTSRIDGGTGTLRLFGRTVNLDNPSVEQDISAAGSIVIRANQDIRVGDINAQGNQAPGQAIALTARRGSITTGNMTTAGTTGGNVTLNAATAITTGAIDTSGSLGNGGNVTLDLSEDVQVDSINAEGSDNGIGGTVSITAGRFFRATDSFTSRNGEQASISTAGGLGGGAITLRHGGNGNIPFYIGAASNNGSRAAITNGTDTFAVGEFFFNSATEGTISILTNTSGGRGEPGRCAANCDPIDEPPRSAITEGIGTIAIPSVAEARALLLALAEQTGIPPALVYISFVSPEIPLPNDFAEREAIASQQITDYLDRSSPNEAPILRAQPRDTDELELMVVLPDGNIVRQRVAGVTRAMVSQARRQLVNDVTAPNRFRSRRYLTHAQQLHQWLIAPLEDELEAQNIGNLAFILDSGLRSIPLSVLHDGNQFLIERYSIGLMPSLSLTDTRYQDLRNVPILAMGASEFDTLLPLPAVPTELNTVTSAVPNSVSYLNQEFTEANLLKTRYERPYGIVHLATHAEFRPGELQNSYIQFGDRRLSLDALRQLRLNDPPVELLVLSACKTALGDEQAELGFGGLAVQAGVRSVLASLWYVSDTGTLSFMSDFYRQLQEAPTRSEALREAQLSMLRGETRIQDDQLITPHGTIPLPPELEGTTDIDLSHPYFWAAFTMIGSPW